MHDRVRPPSRSTSVAALAKPGSPQIDVVAALAALGQDIRLEVFRMLVRAGPDGLPAGAVAITLNIATSLLSFHLDRLKAAGLVATHRDGRFTIYVAQFDAIDALVAYLTEHCRGNDLC